MMSKTRLYDIDFLLLDLKVFLECVRLYEAYTILLIPDDLMNQGKGDSLRTALQSGGTESRKIMKYNSCGAKKRRLLK